MLYILVSFISAITIVFGAIFRWLSYITGFASFVIVFIFLVKSFVDGFDTGWETFKLPLVISLGALIASSIIAFGLKKANSKLPLEDKPLTEQEKIDKRWNDETVQDVVNNVAQYAKKLGETVVTDRKIEDSTYPPTVTTKMCIPSEAERILKTYVYDAHEKSIQQQGRIITDLSVCILAQIRFDENYKQYWEFYLLY